MEPQTEREFILRLEGKIDRLSESIERLAENMQNLDEKKIQVMQTQISELIAWREQIKGGWKLALFIWSALGVAMGVAIKSIWK